MPSQRKRIGFLSSLEVQILIDQICKHNKLSQSKVTGILVEEALNNRGVFNSSINNNSDRIAYGENKFTVVSNVECKNEVNNHNENLGLGESNIEYEIQMINDFIEFKFFKKIMSQKNNIKN